ncbi:hypothetical protein P7K49_016923, partial [Saguinus oedipus]
SDSQAATPDLIFQTPARAWGLKTFTPSPSRFRRSVEKRKLCAKRGAARNSIWCLS